MSRVIEASIKETAFNCPHCSALTTQHWHDVHAERRKSAPSLITPSFKRTVQADPDMPTADKMAMLAWCDKMITGYVWIEDNKTSVYSPIVSNLHLSLCYNCARISVWIYDRLVFPVSKLGIQPNPDLPEDIIRDFNEAREIVASSPRGAAALLRLCVQKICIHLGEKGKHIDTDIANMVKKGLNPLVQESLDIVRVVGNEAVHPGVIDLNDDRDTALQLFNLVNSIAEQMISHPKTVRALYEKLPEEKRKAIQKRDGL